MNDQRIPEGELIDPPHYKDHRVPCKWCGAHWVKMGDGGNEVMTHAEDCDYIEALKEG